MLILLNKCFLTIRLLNDSIGSGIVFNQMQLDNYYYYYYNYYYLLEKWAMFTHGRLRE